MVMDQNLLRMIEDLRMQLGQLRSALGVTTPDAAEATIARMISVVEQHEDTIQQLEERLTTVEQRLTTVEQWIKGQLGAVYEGKYTDAY